MWRKKAAEILRERGYKLTPQRLKLIEVLDEIGSEHPSLNRILSEIKKDFPTVSFSTLYSNVLTLRKLGLLELFSLDGETRVELNTEPHINLIAGKSILDLEDEEILKKIEEKTGRRVKLVNVILD